MSGGGLVDACERVVDHLAELDFRVAERAVTLGLGLPALSDMLVLSSL